MCLSGWKEKIDDYEADPESSNLNEELVLGLKKNYAVCLFLMNEFDASNKAIEEILELDKDVKSYQYETFKELVPFISDYQKRYELGKKFYKWEL